jgi:hypothetical protein
MVVEWGFNPKIAFNGDIIFHGIREPANIDDLPKPI